MIKKWMKLWALGTMLCLIGMWLVASFITFDFYWIQVYHWGPSDRAMFVLCIAMCVVAGFAPAINAKVKND